MSLPHLKGHTTPSRSPQILLVAVILGLSLAAHFLFFKPADVASAANLASISVASFSIPGAIDNPQPSLHENAQHENARFSIPSGGEVWETIGSAIAGTGSVEVFAALAAAGMVLFLFLFSDRIGRRTGTRRRRWPSKRFAIVLSFALLGGLSLFFIYNTRHEIEPVQAANTVLTIDISLNSPEATVDSSTPGNGPRVATIWPKVTNSATGSEAINMAVTLGSFTSGIALLTSQSATYTIPSLAAGSSQSFFWFVTMSTTNETAGTYTVSATASNLFATPTSQTATMTTKDAISAASNKITSVSQSGTGASIGETMTITVEFDLGNVGAPNEAWVQPVSNLNFDASVLRLITAKVTLEGTPQTQDQLFFTGLSGSNTGSVVYTFQAVGIGSTTIIPYQQASSGGAEKIRPLSHGENSHRQCLPGRSVGVCQPGDWSRRGRYVNLYVGCGK